MPGGEPASEGEGKPEGPVAPAVAHGRNGGANGGPGTAPTGNGGTGGGGGGGGGIVGGIGGGNGGGSGGSSRGNTSSNGTKCWLFSDHLESVCGYLMKYTNLVTGWQFRFFVLNNEAGLLEYFVNEQSRAQKPRGSLQLAGAVVSPSDEDSHTFAVNAASGEHYKLRATDAKERQHWVSRLQVSTQHHTEAIGKNNPPLKSRSFSLASPGDGSSPTAQRRPSRSAGSLAGLPGLSRREPLQLDHLIQVQEMMAHAKGQQRDLLKSIEGLPACGRPAALDRDLLLLKATSAATLGCLADCFHILQLQHAARHKGPLLPAGPPGGWPEPRDPPPDRGDHHGADPALAAGPEKPEDQAAAGTGLLDAAPEEVDPDEEVEDTGEDEEDDLGAVEEQRSVILHLLSQLKLGMDLTRVVLPTFTLEKRSLLEMYADFLSHPDLFLAIPGGRTAEDRMVRFVHYYLTAFRQGRKGAVAKKPYNPILGETFHCSWRVGRPAAPEPAAGTPAAEPASDTVRFVAEQVSHHPPVSGFYAECPERGVSVGAHVWTKSKFLGMSIGVTMAGEGLLSLLEHGEEYTFTLPSAYARSILTVPWVELGGKVTINCPKTGYSASVVFHTKPFYGGKVHRVTAEVKQNPSNTVVCRVQGEWNSLLEFTYSNGETKVVELSKLPVTPKRVRPLEKQGPYESRRLWSRVTAALRDSELDKATEHKRVLEERQRSEERHRAETGVPWRTKYFLPEGDGWVYHKPLGKAAPKPQPTD
ncbi:oxysterol-binding protein-related protein 11 [Tachyglossus aculeatus]|uniref:oxysterol-binding protein-related protein 11 n=1 Tax=Tachyglossus aculeatus TaxID=9261 RepID=UPI0018F69B51|nr:oxysterol-binding protein-related protein 11 [Tachyglossus aculeatus]